LHLVPGDRVEFVVEDEGRVVLRASRRTAGELEGMLCHYAKENPVSVEEMDQAIAREAARGDWA
jgi:antitoxin component of MazEF toxin-antitoxin module